MFTASKLRFLFFFVLLLAALSVVPSAQAQLGGFNIRGDLGLKAGSQAPPGGYVGLLYFRYNSDTIKDRNGDTVNIPGELTTGAGAALFTMVFDKKFVGANYGFSIAPLVALNSKIEAPRFGLDPSPGFGDIIVMPISLGWHFKRADVTTAYLFYAPTGRYSVGALDNTSLDMWGHEWDLGTTVFLTENKAWHVATNAAFEFHSGKRHSDAKVGTMLTLEGGLGRDILKGLGSLGLAYAAQWKLTEDTLTGLPALLVQGKNRTFALGPEANLPLIAKKKLFGTFTFRYEWETYARTSLQGNNLIAFLTFFIKPVNLQPPPPPNRAPSATCSAARSSVYAGSGDAVAVRAEASDPDGDALNYAWTASGGTVDGTGPAARWNSAGLGAGSYQIKANISDGKGGTASCDVEIRVEPKPNSAPTMTCSLERSAVLVGERVRITAQASDADNDALTYTWRVSGGQIVGSGASVQLDTSGLAAGRYTVSGRVEDGRGGAVDCSADLNVTQPPPPPEASKLNECLFRAGSARVDNVCKRILDDVALRLQNEPRASLVLVGYADPSERARNLNTNRAAQTAKYLVEKGIAESRLGQRTGSGQAGAGKQNQRVDIVWVPEGATF